MKFKAILLSVLFMLLLLVCAQASATTTTVMMYMCGTDLQSDCVNDIYEMFSVDLPRNVNVVVQAGGASEWDDSDLQPNAINRFAIGHLSFEDIQSPRRGNMGSKDALVDFISWATDAYPADRYILILWDHGGGSMWGICFDETADDDSLTIHEVNDALYAVQQKNPDFHLDIIGFDACLMATYEMAVHMPGYADYMVASEELEPSLGWSYDGWLGDLAANPEMDSADIAVSMVDRYMEACLDVNPNDYLSLSVIDLSVVPTLLRQVETYSAYLTEALENGQLSTISRARQRMYPFGKFADSSSDMVDFMAFLDATRQFAPNMASQIESTYRSAIHYSRGTDLFDYLTGMSILVPGSNVSEFITNFDEQYDCGEKYPNYSQFAYGYATLLAGGNYTFTLQAPTQASASSTGGLFSSLLHADAVPGGTYVVPEDASNDAVVTESGRPQTTGTGWNGFDSVLSGFITPDDSEEEDECAFFSDMDTDYACYMTLSQDELANLSLAEGLLYLDASDDEDTIWVELGAMQNAGIDWQTGDIVSGFDGTWPMLEDQLVVLYDQVRTQSMRRSVIPVTLNGKDGYLIVIFTAAHPEGVISGFSEGYDANGLPVRGITQLAKGDEIIPTYPILYDDGTGEMVEDTIEGDPIIVGNTLPTFEYVSLEGADSTFLYCFRLTDIFGQSELSEMIDFYL